MIEVLHHYGLLALFVAVLLDSFGVPLPGETLLVAAGVLAGSGELNIAAVVAVAAVAAALGNGVGYEIGRRGGRSLVMAAARKAGIDEDRIERLQAHIQRHGATLVVFARLVPLLRELNGLIAGSVMMDRRRFWAANAAGAVLWAALFGLGAYEFGKRVHIWRFLQGHVQLLAALVLTVALVATAVGWWRRRGRQSK